MNAPIRVLIAEDSPLFAEALSDVVSGGTGLQVCGMAADGRAAVANCLALEPDLVIMDVRMPVMDGLEAIEQIMALRPTPILVMTADPRGETGELAVEALRRGALDLIRKPMSWPGDAVEIEAFRDRIRLLSTISVVRHMRPQSLRPQRVQRRTVAPRIVGLVASTGGPPALARILGALPADYPLPIAVVQHISAGFEANLVRWLGSVTPLAVSLAVEGSRVQAGRVLVAPDGAHLEIASTGRAVLTPGDSVDGHRPSGTVLLRSLARSYGAAAAGAVLTGMGRDGAAGLRAIKEAGGAAVAQDEASSAVWGMPRAAVELGAASEELALASVAPWMLRIAGRPE